VPAAASAPVAEIAEIAMAANMATAQWDALNSLSARDRKIMSPLPRDELTPPPSDRRSDRAMNITVPPWIE
jgi:hypothetical protein